MTLDPKMNTKLCRIISKCDQGNVFLIRYISDGGSIMPDILSAPGVFRVQVSLKVTRDISWIWWLWWSLYDDYDDDGWWLWCLWIINVDDDDNMMTERWDQASLCLATQQTLGTLFCFGDRQESIIFIIFMIIEKHHLHYDHQNRSYLDQYFNFTFHP